MRHGLFQNDFHFVFRHGFSTPWIKDLQKSAHVRPLIMLRQGHGEANARQNLLKAAVFHFNQQRQVYLVNPHLLDRNAPLIRAALYIFHDLMPAFRRKWDQESLLLGSLSGEAGNCHRRRRLFPHLDSSYG